MCLWGMLASALEDALHHANLTAHIPARACLVDIDP